MLVYHGVGNGLTAYQDVIQIGADLDITTADPKTSGNGLVYTGKRNPGDTDYYSGASVDEDQNVQWTVDPARNL